MPSRRVILRSFLGALWLVCLYRAVTQSIVHDEALTYEVYVNAPFSRMFTFFDANHHFLNTLLMRLSVGVFGISEWSVRLPALAAAAVYFYAVYLIGLKLMRGAAAASLAVTLLTLNPFVLDFMVAARGYGAALALFTYALVLLATYAREKTAAKPSTLAQAAVALALSVTANLVFAVPVLVIVVLTLALLRPSRPQLPPVEKRKKKAAVQKPVPNPVYRYFLAPLAAIGVLFFMTAPFQQATSANFYVGAASIAESLRSLASASLAYGGLLSAGRFAVDAAAFFAAPLLLIGALALGIRRRDPLLLLTAGTAVGSAILLALAHVLFGILYPVDRTGIYFLVLAPLCLAILADAELHHAARGLFTALGLLLVLQFAIEFNVTSFLTWKYDADTREIVDHLARAAGQRPPASVTVGASWQLEPSLNFYREKNRLTWLRPVGRGALAPGADFYAVMAMDRAALATLNLKPLYEGPRSGSVLAVPSR